MIDCGEMLSPEAGAWSEALRSAQEPWGALTLPVWKGTKYNATYVELWSYITFSISKYMFMP
jgi:hypothetical protein